MQLVLLKPTIPLTNPKHGRPRRGSRLVRQAAANTRLAAAHPVVIGVRRVGEILFVPDMTVDLYEKWLGFLAIVSSGAACSRWRRSAPI